MDMRECCTFSLGSYSKQAGDEHHLIHDISFDHSVHLTLSDHVHAMVIVRNIWQKLSNIER